MKDEIMLFSVLQSFVYKYAIFSFVNSSSNTNYIITFQNVGTHVFVIWIVAPQ